MKILIFFTIWFEIDLCDNNNNNKKSIRKRALKIDIFYYFFLQRSKQKKAFYGKSELDSKSCSSSFLFKICKIRPFDSTLQNEESVHVLGSPALVACKGLENKFSTLIGL